MSYKAPLKEYKFLLNDVLDAAVLAETSLYRESSLDIFDAVLEEAGKFAEKVLAPLGRSGDEQGCGFENGHVTTPDGFLEAYKVFQDGGWPGLSMHEEHGGQGLPHSLYTLVDEEITTANIGFAMYRGLTEGAYNTIRTYGSEALKSQYLEQLASGALLPTMNLTEPHCGSDLGLIRTKAEPEADGSYTVTGTKIFITGGEHDLTKNILHLVLARLPDAPKGSRGISLLLVPKYYEVNGQEIRNAVTCSGVEHKMGLKASATCVMNYDGAKGWLVGAPHTGLLAMFTMMNAARLAVGVQGVCAAEGALQIAEAYAAERRQGKAPNSTTEGPDTIDQHPDVQRMLRTQKAFSQGGRSLVLRTALSLDLSHAAEGNLTREKHDDFVQLITPVVKAFLTEAGLEAANLGVQVLGGHGYIREWGVEQWVRDIRIALIYEGTNAIQAMDLVGRKLPMKKGAVVESYFQSIQCEFEKARPDFAVVSDGEVALETLRTITADLATASPVQVLEVATDYLMLFGLVALAREWAHMARVASANKDQDLEFYSDKIETASFYMTRILPRYLGHAAVIRSCLAKS